jgi:hypothetical protein
LQPSTGHSISKTEVSYTDWIVVTFMLIWVSVLADMCKAFVAYIMLHYMHVAQYNVL